MWFNIIGYKKACDTNNIIVKHMYTRNQVKGLTAPSCTRIDSRNVVQHNRESTRPSSTPRTSFHSCTVRNGVSILMHQTA